MYQTFLSLAVAQHTCTVYMYLLTSITLAQHTYTCTSHTSPLYNTHPVRYLTLLSLAQNTYMYLTRLSLLEHTCACHLQNILYTHTPDTLKLAQHKYVYVYLTPLLLAQHIQLYKNAPRILITFTIHIQKSTWHPYLLHSTHNMYPTSLLLAQHTHIPDIHSTCTAHKHTQTRNHHTHILLLTVY